MDFPFRIEKRDSFRVVGSLIETTNKKGGGRKDIPIFWSKFKEDNLEASLLDLSDRSGPTHKGFLCIRLKQPEHSPNIHSLLKTLPLIDRHKRP